MNRFTCPYCHGQLNVHGLVVLSAHADSGERGLVLLSEELGDFTVHLSNNLMGTVSEGDHLHFHCSTCQHSLEYKENPKLARLFKTDEGGNEHTIIFSAIFGEQSTFEISEERTKSFGEHALRYMDPDWYRKA
jgi:hypothetical protein